MIFKHHFVQSIKVSFKQTILQRGPEAPVEGPQSLTYKKDIACDSLTMMFWFF